MSLPVHNCPANMQDSRRCQEYMPQLSDFQAGEKLITILPATRRAKKNHRAIWLFATIYSGRRQYQLDYPILDRDQDFLWQTPCRVLNCYRTATPAYLPDRFYLPMRDI